MLRKTKADIGKSPHQLFVLVCVSEIVAAVYQIIICYFTAHEHLLRCVQIGLSISELDLLTIGTVNDMYAEMSNDDFNYPALATQEQMDRF